MAADRGCPSNSVEEKSLSSSCAKWHFERRVILFESEGGIWGFCADHVGDAEAFEHISHGLLDGLPTSMQWARTLVIAITGAQDALLEARVVLDGADDVHDGDRRRVSSEGKASPRSACGAENASPNQGLKHLAGEVLRDIGPFAELSHRANASGSLH